MIRTHHELATSAFGGAWGRGRISNSEALYFARMIDRGGTAWPGRAARLLAVACLSGCGGSHIDAALSDYAVMPAYSAEEIQKATANRTLRVVLLGNPFGWPEATSAENVAASMNDSGTLAGVRFRTGATDSAGAPYRVVWNFSPPNEICAKGSCRNN